MTVYPHRLSNRLLLRMLLPTVLVVGLVAAGMYVFVLRSVSDFADEQIRESLMDVAGEIYDLCDENFSELMHSGKAGDPRSVTIRKAYTIGAIEEFVVRSDVSCRLTNAGEEDLLRIRMDADLLDAIAGNRDEGTAFRFDHHGKTLYYYPITFKPWGWRVDLVKDMHAYAPLISRVKAIYLVTGELLLGGLLLLLLLQERLFRRPLIRIVRAVRKGQPPAYRGIHEFAFLADSISAMMHSLKVRNQWVERLYAIAITHRGQACFTHVADALSDTLAAGILIVAETPQENEFRPIACSMGPMEKDPSDFIDDLPLRKIVRDKHAVVFENTPDTDTRTACLPGIFSAHAGSYAGVPVLSRENTVIGVVNVFGQGLSFDTWRMSLIKTVCQMVAVELEFAAREKERLQLEAQLQKSQKMEAIGTLAGGVAHDLNNILSGIVSYPDLLLMDLPEGSPLRQPILTIKQSGERAATIVQDLLTLARRGVAISEVVDLNSIITGQLRSPEFEKLISFHPRVTVDTDLAPDLLPVKGSTTHLAKSIMNLISNAAEAMPGGGRIHIATQNCYVDYLTRGHDQMKEGEYVRVTVSDTGIGISDRDKDRIFEPFYTKKVMGRSGTGLGMAVVYGTIMDHNGHIAFDSIEGSGTTFTLHFPATREDISVEAAANRGDIASCLGRGESVLVVDDVRQQRELASAMLSRLNYTVTAVASGEAAIAYLEDNPVDLLILDMIMAPGMDGLDTYRQVVERYPGQKAIIASGFSETRRVRAAQRLGVGTYLKKPYTLQAMGMAVRAALDRSDAAE